LAIERVAEGAHSSATPATGRFPLLLFSQELLTLLDAGLHLNEALTTLAAKEKQPHVRLILQRVLHALAEGRNFSDVLGDAPQHFPEVYVATVRASERTGDLPRALARYIAYQLQFEQLRKKLISASIYPAMLLGVGGFVALFLLGYVVPKFASVYESSGREMPWLSRVMLDMGRILHAHGSAALMILVGLVLLGAVAARSAVVKRWAIDQLLSMPGLARVSQEFRLARFYRAVSLLLASGIPLPRAMPMVAGLLSGEQQQRLSKARRLVDEGHAFSAALVSCNLAGPVAESLIKVGERSGQLAEMLERTAGFHDEEFSRWVDWASRLLEPILMTVIGGVIGVVVVLMYLPIFDLAGSLQ
jgi:general secretion pathway protein F